MLTPRLRAFARDETAVAAVEFSFIAPAALAFLALIMASQQSLTAWRKVISTAHEITDLVARTPYSPDSSVATAEDLAQSALNNDLALSQLVMYPLGTTGVQIVMSEVQVVPASNSGVVKWSQGYNGATALACATSIPLSAAYVQTGATYLVIGQVTYTFQPLGITFNLPAMTLTSTEILSIRNAQQIIVPGIQCP